MLEKPIFFVKNQRLQSRFIIEVIARLGPLIFHALLTDETL